MEYGDKNIIQYNTRVINCEVTHSQRFSVDVEALKDNYYVNAYVARSLVMSTRVLLLLNYIIKVTQTQIFQLVNSTIEYVSTHF